MDYITKALGMAVKAHYGAKDKGGNDYVLHPITVALHCVTEEEKVVALLHDVVEDTSVTLIDLKKDFPESIVNGVDAITRRTGEDREMYLERVKSNVIARAVKIADLIHNSDLTRIPNPTEKDFKRVEKYKKELQFLAEQ